MKQKVYSAFADVKKLSSAGLFISLCAAMSFCGCKVTESSAPIAAEAEAPVAAEAPTVFVPGTVEENPFGELILVDEIDCTQETHNLTVYPRDNSRIETILGVSHRVLDVREDECSYIKVTVGKGKKLKPHGSYVLVIDYPDDLPRNYLVRNMAMESKRSFYTGRNGGDCFNAHYVDHNLESLDIPQSGKIEKWAAYMSIHDFTIDEHEKERKDVLADEGFELVIAQYTRKQDPNTHGVALSKIYLYEIPDEKAVYAKLVLPPENLPQRHLFWREEMADGGMDRNNPKIGFIRHKFRQLKMMGMDTYCKDLLEFGHVQHWDPLASGIYMWDSADRKVWDSIVEEAAAQDLNILPYYEYAGANYMDRNGKPSLGRQLKAEPLNTDIKPEMKNCYTHIWWSEKLRVDITDQDTYDEFKQVIYGTLLRYEEQKKNMLGVWIRPRPAQMAVGFADATRERFAYEANNKVPVSRDDLRKDKTLYDRYIKWWGKKRAEFGAGMRDYMKDNGIKNPIVIFDGDTSEPGSGMINQRGIVTDNPEYWREIFSKAPFNYQDPNKSITDIRNPAIVDEHWFLKGVKRPAGTWGHWEWQHACPGADPESYHDVNNVWISMTFHRVFSVSDPYCFNQFSNANGGQTIIRHYGLNENNLFRFERDENYNIIKDDKGNNKTTRLCGYAIHDSERAGRACMQSEVLAMANGNPFNIGYLIGSTFTRGFAGPVREFNRNFLALPALPSEVVADACADKEVVLRKVATENDGTYFALTHTGYTAKTVDVRFPAGTANLKVVVSGKEVPLKADGSVSIEMQPWQLVTFVAK